MEVLRRPSAASASVPASHRNSAYIPPPKSPSSSLKESKELQSFPINGHDHEFEDDEEMASEDLLVPGLDYEGIKANPLSSVGREM